MYNECAWFSLEPAREAVGGKDKSMITIELDLASEKQLEALARRQGRDVSQVIAYIVEAYLDAKNWSQDSIDDWANASATLAAETFAEESWEEGESAHGPG
jgi:predicted transcriptional regulator